MMASRVHEGERSARVRAHAKLNVTLEVLRRRGDGYHDVVHVMQLLELHDIVVLGRRSDGQIHFASTSSAIDPADNLCVDAAWALKERFGVTAGLDIELDKRIPVAAGLGGGSSDAAAVLVSASRLWGLSPTRAELVELAAALGSDVPFFLVGGLAICEGRGERVTPLPAHWPSSMRWLLLLKLPDGVPTAEAYRHLPPKCFTDGSHGRTLRDRLESGAGFALDDVKNSMTESVLERFPTVARTRDLLLEAGAPRAELCGTGSTMFAPFDRLESALGVQRRLLEHREVEPAMILLTQACRGRD